MKAAEVQFQELLNGKIQYRVPLFQRTYNWQEDNWQRLWDDLLEVYALPQPRTHFLGAIVTLPQPDSPERVGKYMLIDGQQRLATLFVLLAHIRDRASGTDLDTLANQIDDECLMNKYAPVNDEKEKLRPTQRDLPSFLSILTHEDPDTDSNLGEAYTFFSDQINKGDLEGEPIDLSKLKSCITDYLSLVSIRLDDGDSPHRIFESLNNTGMPLTASDLVRNELFMRITDDKALNHAYNRFWLPMQQSMEYGRGRSNLSDFFWRYLMTDGSLPRYDEVYEAMKRLIDDRVNRSENVTAILEDLKTYSEYYVRVWKPEQNEAHPEIRKQMARLNLWQVDVAYPFLLTAMTKRNDGQITDEEFLQALYMIESYLVRRFVCGIPSNRLRRIFARMDQAVGDSDFVEGCRAYLARNEWPNDDLFREQFQTARIYLSSRLSRTRLILSALEQSFEHHEPVEMSDKITIEHIMPRTLNHQWRQDLGPQAEAIHAKYLHTVGNLTFSGYNTEMGNIAFGEKTPILAESHFELNRDVVQAESWTDKEIKDRAQRLANRAVVIWQR